VDDGIVR